jgi:undecaprenyl-diphosphatase
VIGAAVAKTIFDGVRHGFSAADPTSLIAGIVVSGFVGYLSIAFLLRYLATHSTYIFVYYRIVLGVLVAVAYWQGLR